MTISSHVIGLLRENPSLQPRDLRKYYPELTPKNQWWTLEKARRKLRAELAKEAVHEPAPEAEGSKKSPKHTKEIKEPKLFAGHTSLRADKAKREMQLGQEDALALQRKYASALKEVALVDRLVRIAKEVAPTSYEVDPPKPTKGACPAHSAQSAVLLLGDTHIGKVVRPEQTLGFGRYNFDMFCSRLKHLEERVISILKDHTQCKVNQLVVAMLGDMVDGSLSHGAEAAQVATVFAQVYAGAHVLAQFFRNISAHVPIRIESVVGNHGRWANQKKMPTKNRYSNLDAFLYALVQALLRDIPHIQYELTEEPFRVFDVEGTTIWIGHGDHLRGGDKALGVPIHSIARQLSTTAQMHAQHHRAVPQIYCVGDKHKRIELPHPNGDFIINGAFPGYDEYAHASNFADAGADQKMFLVHPSYGRSATYNLYLSRVKEKKGLYTVPKNFQLP